MFVALGAFTGMRKEELQRLRWEDVGEEWIVVGADGMTKGKTFRRVPVCGPLREVLATIPEADRLGTVVRMKSPRRALHSACAKLKLADMRSHDLRHWFATWAIQSGVDIPTVAKWLGHVDGGALCMRTYGHVQDAHSVEAATKLRL